MPQEHYYKEKTTIPLKLGLVSALIRQTEFEFYTSTPVFSWREVDRGTIVLAENMEISGTATNLLDVGCGYGVLGIVAAHFNPNLKVTMTDVSDRAVMLTKKNVKKYNLQQRCTVLKGDVYEPVALEKFDVIVCNPPYSAGKSIVNRIIQQAPWHLNAGGSLQIVGRHSKGGKMYKEEMSKYFHTIEEAGKTGGFRVYIGKEPTKVVENMPAPAAAEA